MSENKPIRDEEPIMAADAIAKKPIGDWSLISTVAAVDTRIFFGLWTVGVGKQGPLLTSTSFVYFLSLFRPMEA